MEFPYQLEYSIELINYQQDLKRKLEELNLSNSSLSNKKQASNKNQISNKNQVSNKKYVHNKDNKSRNNDCLNDNIFINGNKCRKIR